MGLDPEGSPRFNAMRSLWLRLNLSRAEPQVQCHTFIVGGVQMSSPAGPAGGARLGAALFPCMHALLQISVSAGPCGAAV